MDISTNVFMKEQIKFKKKIKFITDHLTLIFWAMLGET